MYTYMCVYISIYILTNHNFRFHGFDYNLFSGDSYPFQSGGGVSNFSHKAACHLFSAFPGEGAGTADSNRVPGHSVPGSRLDTFPWSLISSAPHNIFKYPNYQTRKESDRFVSREVLYIRLAIWL